MLTVAGQAIRIRPYQVIVWISIAPVNQWEWDPRLPRLPALLDTGYNHNFSIQERHLREWAGIDSRFLAELGHLRERRQRIPLHAGTLWLHPNRPGYRDEFRETPPHRLLVEEGFAIHPDDGTNHPRLPLLGLKALTDNDLHLAVSGWRRSVNLRTRRWWWPFE